MVTTSNKNYIVNGPNPLVWLESSEWSETFEIKTFYQNWIDIVRTNFRAETSLQKRIVEVLWTEEICFISFLPKLPLAI